MTVTREHVVADDGERIALTVHGSTYVFKGETAKIVRAERAQHTDPVASAAFLHGFLVAVALAISKTEKPANGKA